MDPRVVIAAALLCTAPSVVSGADVVLECNDCSESQRVKQASAAPTLFEKIHIVDGTHLQVHSYDRSTLADAKVQPVPGTDDVPARLLSAIKAKKCVDDVSCSGRNRRQTGGFHELQRDRPQSAGTGSVDRGTLLPATELMRLGVANVFPGLGLDDIFQVEFLFAQGGSLLVDLELVVALDDRQIGYIRYHIVDEPRNAGTISR